jgi:hypothetical protein
MEILEQYIEEIQNDLKFDQINVLEKQLMIPAIKHKWVARLMRSKVKKNELEKKKKEIKEGVLSKLQVPTGMPKAAINLKIDTSEEVVKMNDEIKDLDVIIEYLEKVEKIFGSTTYDIGNITKLMVLETT